MENPESKFQDLFKSKNKSDLQKERRHALLKAQKLQRSLHQDESRNLESFCRQGHNKTGKSKPKAKTFKYKYQTDHRLQLSEWMKDKPEDVNDWFLVPCPKGQRCMVIACNGYTEMYSKAGRLYDTFDSLLPGNVGSKNDVTILDCVYVEGRSTFYVLDTLAYGNQDMMNCEAQFRFFWLTSKFRESSLNEISMRNQYAFECLEFYDFENAERVSMGLQQYPLWEDNCPELDGFLFYHKEASYTCGTTPLVGWLFAFMVPEVLGFPVNTAYMDQKPEDYTDYIRYIVNFDEDMAKKRQKYQKRQNSNGDAMDEGILNEDDDNAALKALLNAERDLELEDEAVDFVEHNTL